MAGQGYSVEFTVGVLEKLAGIRIAPKPQQAGLPKLSGFSNPEVVALAKGDAQLSKALQSSRRIGGLLLKQEEEEGEKVKQLAQELLKKHNYSTSPVPCEAERAAVLDCYQASKEDPLKCAAAVQSYADCGGAAFNRYVKRVNSAASAS